VVCWSRCLIVGTDEVDVLLPRSVRIDWIYRVVEPVGRECPRCPRRPAESMAAHRGTSLVRRSDPDPQGGRPAVATASIPRRTSTKPPAVSATPDLEQARIPGIDRSCEDQKRRADGADRPRTTGLKTASFDLNSFDSNSVARALSLSARASSAAWREVGALLIASSRN
jgi:hypothetical protein